MEVIKWFVLFLIGCFIGWIIELFYRNLINKKKINPGFLRGPYLPIYGFVTLLFYFIVDSRINSIHKIILLIIIPTSIELLTGLIFEKYFRIKLWDYSKNFLNFKGIICPLASFCWIILSMIYYFILHDLVSNFLLVTFSNANYIFLYGAIAGIFLLDIFYSFNVAFRVRKMAKELGEKRINFNKFKKAGDAFNNIKVKIQKIITEKIQTKNN